MKKRILSLLIAFAILLPLCPTGLLRAAAADGDDLFSVLDTTEVGTTKDELLTYYTNQFKTYDTQPFSGTTNRLITHVEKNIVSYQENEAAYSQITGSSTGGYQKYEIDLAGNTSGQYVIDAIERSDSDITIASKEHQTAAYRPTLIVTMSDGTTQEIVASADTYVQRGSDDAAEKKNYGSLQFLLTRHSVSNGAAPYNPISDGTATAPYSSESKRIYLQFSVPSGAKTAKLRIYAYVDSSEQQTIDIAVFNSFAKNWDESKLSWWYLRTNNGEAEKAEKSDSAKLVGLFGHFCYDGVNGGFNWKNPGGAHQEWINYNTRFYEITTLVQTAEKQPEKKAYYLGLAKETLLDFITDTFGTAFKNDTELASYKSCPAGRDIEAANRAAEFPYIYDALLTNGLLNEDENYRILCWVYAETYYMYHDGSKQLFDGATAEPSPKTSYAATNRGAWHLMGLYSNLQYFNEFTDSANWKSTFDARLTYVLGELINEDGSYSEMTFAYPIDCLGWFQYLLNLMDSFGDTAGSNQIREKMVKLTRYLIACSYSDGTMPRWGEGAARGVSDAIDLLLEMIPDDSSCTNSTEYQNILWFQDHTTGIMPDTAAKYGDVSVVTDRTGWTEDAAMLFMNAKVGGNHSHRDALALLLFYDGKELLTDTGMTSYTSGTPEFVWQRVQSASHNTIEVDGLGQLYSLTQQSEEDGHYGKIVSSGANDATTFIRGWTNAVTAMGESTIVKDAKTGNIENPIYQTHNRNVTFVKSLDEFLIVSDYVESADTRSHTYTQNWHTAPGATISANGTTGTATFADGPSLTILQVGNSGSISLDVTKDSYDARSASPVKFFQYTQTKAGNVEFNTVLYPSHAGQNVTISTAEKETDASNQAVSAMTIQITDKTNNTSTTVNYYNSFEEETRTKHTATYDKYTLTTDAATALRMQHNEDNKATVEMSLANGTYLEDEYGYKISASQTVSDLTATVVDGVLNIQTSDDGVINGSTTVNVTWAYGTAIQSVTLNGESGAEYSVAAHRAVLNPSRGLLLHFDESSKMNSLNDWDFYAAKDYGIDQEESKIYGTFNGTAENNATNGLIRSKGDFSYTIQPGDELEIRTAIRNDDLEGNTLYRIVIDYWLEGDKPDSPSGRSELYSNEAPMDTGGGYEVYNFGSLDAYAGKTITKFQIGYYVDNSTLGGTADAYKTDEVKVDGEFAIDYIYVGQEKGSPSRYDGYLLFDFTNTQQDRARYQSDIYGNINYDTLDQQTNSESNQYAWFQWWGWKSGKSDDWFAIDNANEGTLTVKKANNNKSLYAQTGWKDNSTNGLPLNYSPEKDDYIQIRVRFENCNLLNETPVLKVSYAVDGETKVDTTHYASMYLDPDQVVSGEYMVYTMSVTQAMAAASKITALRVEFSNIDVSGTDAKAVIDYIYLGGEAHLPNGIMEDVPYLPENRYDESGHTGGLGTDNDIIEYPNDGAVRLNKTATADNWYSTGIAKLELNAAGISVPSGLDVLFVLDISNSMAWSAENGGATNTTQRLPSGNQTTKLYDALSMMDAMSAELLAEGDNTVSLVTFAGYDEQNYDTSSDYSSDGFVDSVQTLFTAQSDYSLVKKALSLTRVTGYVYTDTADGKTQKVDYRVSLAGIDGSGKITTSTGKNMGGTNYDFAFWQANQAAEAIKTYNADNNKTDRKTVVVFLTDGLATTYNDQCSYDSRHYNTKVKGETVRQTIKHTIPGSDELPGIVGETNTEWFDALKGLGANTYAKTLLTNIDRLEVIGFDMAHGLFNGMTSSEETMGQVKNILEGIVSVDSGSEGTAAAEIKTFHVTDAKDSVALNQFQDELISALKYAATYTTVEDTVGENYDLAMSQGHTIVVSRYTLDENGERSGEPTVLETVTFNADGTEAYSSKLGADKNILRVKDGVTIISAAFFTFKKDAASNETFNWRIGRIDGCEYALVYDVYLTGSMEGTREKGTYPTNDAADLKYLNIDNKYMDREYHKPELSWGGAATRAEYYLVNEAGQPVNSNGYVIPFANRIIVGYGDLVEMNWNESIIVYGSAYVPAMYTMFNPAAYYTVEASSDGNGDTFKIAKEDPITTYRVDGGASTAYTQVAFGVTKKTESGEVNPKPNPDTVVLDYGKPIDINVTANETELDYHYTAVGLAAYNANTDVSQRVGENKWTSLIHGSSGTFTIANGIVTYTPTAMLSKQEDVFVVVKVTKNGSASEYFYAYQQLTVIPASNVLYETDFADGVFTTSGADTGWVNNLSETAGKDNRQDDGTPGGAVDNTVDTSLFFGFDNSGAAQERYSGSAYGGTNFDTVNNWSYDKNRVASLSIDGGAIVATVTAGNSSPYFQTGTYNNIETFNLNYDSSVNGKYVEIRLKLENFAVVPNKSASIGLHAYTPACDGAYSKLKPVGSWSITDDNKGILTSGEYVTLKAQINGISGNVIQSLRFQLSNITNISDKTATVTVDYIYIGSEEDLPSKQNLYIGFDNTYGDLERYSGGAYGGANFDSVENWSSYPESTKISNGTMTLGTATTGNYFRAMTNSKLCYQPSENDYLQVRFKISNVKSSKSTGVGQFVLYYELSDFNSPSSYVYYEFDATEMEGNGWYTLTKKITDLGCLSGNGNVRTWYRDMDEINDLGLCFYLLKSGDGSNPPEFEIDYLYIGTEEGLPTEQTYGYDSSYTDDVQYSNGTTLYAEGQGRTVTTADFEFTGTGFDIISATGKEHGSIRVTVTRKSDGEVVKTVSVTNKSDSELDLYQIPVVSVEGLDYETYQVQIGVNNGYSNVKYPQLYRGNQFVFDAVRIFNPLESDANETARKAYTKDNELTPDVKEIRDELLLNGAEDADFNDSWTGGIGFVDYFYANRDGENDFANIGTLDLAKYTAIGPKNEVYLSKGQAVTFKVTADALPTGMDIGAKSANGAAVTMVAAIGKTKNATVSNTVTKEIKTCTAMFYDLFAGIGASYAIGDIFERNSDGKYVAYVTVTNTGDGILSLTDVKLTYGEDAQGAVQTAAFSVDADTMVFAAYVLNNLFAADDTPEIKDGIVEENGELYYYADGSLQYNAGLLLVGESYYYVRSNGKLAVGQYWVTNTNGLLPEGFYTFGADGKMIVPADGNDGIVEENGELYYYVNGELQYAAGLIELDGDYYYVRSSGKLAVGQYWVTTTNGLLPEGFYTFGSDGKLLRSEEAQNGIVEENGELYYYLNGTIQYNAGLIQLDGDYYYVRSSGKLATGQYWITTTNGLLPAGLYTFGADGKMILP